MTSMTDVFDLSDWRIVRTWRRRVGRRDRVVEAVFGPKPLRCLKCHASGPLHVHGKKGSDYRDLPVDEIPTTVRVDRRRYRCVSCGVTALQPLPDMDDRHRMTQRLIQWIQREAVRRPFTAIAAEVGIHEKTVRRIVEDCLPDLRGRPRPVYAPLMLGISQMKLHGRLRTVLVDVGNLVILDVLPSILGPSIAKWLNKLSQRERVQVVSIGLRPTHRNVVRKCLGPLVVLMVEKEAFIGVANAALQAVRGAVKRQTMAGRRATGDLRLKAAEDARDGFAEIYERRSSPAAHRALADWRAALAHGTRRDFASLLLATEVWGDEFIRFFDQRAATIHLGDLNAALGCIELRFCGLPFATARSEILAAPAIKAPTGFNRCEHCGNEFRRRQVQAKYTVAVDQVARTSNARLRRMCRRCHQLLMDS
jgi:transposase